MKISICAPVDIHSLARFSGQSTEGIAPGLGSTATTPLILKMLSRGHQVVVYTLSPGLAKEQIYQWGNLRIFVGESRVGHPARDFFRQEVACMRRAIESDAPPFVHSHWTYEFSLAALNSGVPTLVTIHDLPWNVLRYFRDPYRTARLMMAYAVAIRGKHFTAVSEDTAAHFRRYMRPGAEIAVVPNGLPDAIFELQEPRVKEPGEVCTFAMILQGWSRRKNPIAALRSFSIVRRSLPGARLFAFGADYEEGGPAHRWARNHHNAEAVHFVGQLPHPELLARLQAEVDIIVHPSLDEAFSMTALEALVLRKPIIAGKSTPGMRDLLGGGEAGILVDMRNPQAIAEQMIRLAIDPQLRAVFAQAGYDRASRLYRLDAVMEQYESLYEKIERR